MLLNMVTLTDRHTTLDLGFGFNHIPKPIWTLQYLLYQSTDIYERKKTWVIFLHQT